MCELDGMAAAGMFYAAMCAGCEAHCDRPACAQGVCNLEEVLICRHTYGGQQLCNQPSQSGANARQQELRRSRHDHPIARCPTEELPSLGTSPGNHLTQSAWWDSAAWQELQNRNHLCQLVDRHKSSTCRFTCQGGPLRGRDCLAGAVHLARAEDTAGEPAAAAPGMLSAARSTVQGATLCFRRAQSAQPLDQECTACSPTFDEARGRCSVQTDPDPCTPCL